MTVKRYKECPIKRARRLSLGKPHVFWSRTWGEWLVDSRVRGVAVRDHSKAARFCIEQDRRWTPRDAK